MKPERKKQGYGCWADSTTKIRERLGKRMSVLDADGAEHIQKKSQCTVLP